MPWLCYTKKGGVGLHIDKKTIRSLCLAGIGCIVVYWLLHETERFQTMWSSLSAMWAPFVIGAAIAFVLNVPMRAIERKLKFVHKDGLRRTLGIFLTLIFLALILVGVFWLIIPQISETVQLLIPRLSEFFLHLEEIAVGFLNENPQLMRWVSENTGIEQLDWTGLIQEAATLLKSSLTVIASSAITAVGGVTSAIVDAVIAIVFSLYCLARKEILARQGRRILYSILPEHATDEIIRILRLTNSTFSNFISGQCLEAIILGCLFAVTMAIMKMPYITLVSVLIAVTALVPIVGAFVGCAVSAFLILVNDPLQALIFVAMFLVLQQIEGNLIYPKVVGTSIGLPGMWVLVAVTVGGDLMGVGGMLIMIPISSVLYTLLREFTTRRIDQRKIPPEKLVDQPPELKSKFKENRERKKEQKLLKQMKDLASKHAVTHHKKEH